MSAPPPDMLPGKPEDYYTRIPRGMGGTDDRPWILARNILGALLFAGLAVYFNGAGNPTAALFCLTTAGALFLHSGRRRGKGGPMDPSTAGLPLICLAVLAFGGCSMTRAILAILIITLGACDGTIIAVGGTVSPTEPRKASPGILAGSNTDYVRLTTQAALPAACANPYGCLYMKSADSLPRLVDPSGNEYVAGTTWRARQVAGTPGSVATHDIWADTTTGFLMWRSSGGNVIIGNTGGWVTLDTAQTITGVKTISGGLLASGTGYLDFSGGSGIFKPPTGAATFGGSSNAFTNAVSLNGAVTAGDAAADVVTVKGTLRVDNTANTFYVTLTHAATANRAVTLPDAAGAVCIDSATQTLSNKTLTAPVINGVTSSSGNFDLSGSGGTTKTTTGAVTIGPGAVGVSGDVTLTTTKTLTAGANTLISGDKLQASMLAIGSQATGDLLYASSGTAWARLAVGSTGQVPTVSGGVPAWANPVHSVITGGARGTLGATTGYLSAPGVAWSTTTEPVLMVATRTATVRNLYCDLGTAPGGADTVVVTVRKNAADQTTTCTITGAGTTCNDTSNTFAVAAGNRLTIKGVSSAGVAADLHCSVEVGN